MRAAYRLARDALPAYSSEFSRHDYTLPQLFACLAVKESLRRSYREAARRCWRTATPGDGTSD